MLITFRLSESAEYRASPNLSILRQALERGTRHSSGFSETPIIIGFFESGE
jgi:hypothetical protein